MPNSESCFWAEVEELCTENGSPGIKESITTLRNRVKKWIQDGEQGEEEITGPREDLSMQGRLSSVFVKDFQAKIEFFLSSPSILHGRPQ
ncbi:hypothetical protein DKX38_018635 [Salix brachista]|uniref:Uncharacterized protein n=1 Tax=Salix brachista TaxID=2182728 RepID=A0A5N5KNJ6_9ROSI|nr:hypothetical protein DKX38_018635 [Salix brachista]